ncbi:putative ABC transporter substrate-binding protein [Vibrio halioticoli NBRC 102217]|uniref:Putative ABC transporter substrate-binding protein n=1 Tax=Vibrio halioticoli NBRC 102217 TaxID=1219072 RepID=V5EZI8_9VIBR|nr:ABC transporter substrate-binding protein [Vibrio halioticoli]GAD88234.1 putative ABC transporter substrate-binding protein [Vibrio halioticoli NBRC 102217]
MTNISYSSVARKKRIVRASLLIAIIIIGGIFWFSSSPQAELTPQKSNTLSISGPWEISSLDPAKQGYILTRMQVIETLLNVSDTGEIIPGLATKWQVSDDGLNWLFTLRENVQFQDGTSMDTQSVLKSLHFAMQKHGTLSKAEIETIDTVGEHQIRIQLAQPYIAFTALLTNYSTAILSSASYAENGDIVALYGTGPYQIEQFSPPHKLVVKHYEHYWGKKGQIPFASYLTGHRAESRILQAKSGEADIVFTLDPSMIGQLDGGENVTVHSNLIPRTLFVKLNSQHPYLKEVQARQALSMAINRSSIANNVLHSPGSQTTQLLPKSMSKWYIQDLPSDEFNLSQAKALLSQLGWKSNDNGVLTRDGKPFELTLITYADRPELTTVATAIQAQWAKLGVTLKINVTNSSMIPAGHSDGSLEVALIARNFGFIADPLPIMSSDFSNGGGDWGTMNWHNPVVDNAMSELLQTSDAAQSRLLSQKVALAIHNDYPVLPISSYSQHTSVNSRVQNFHFDPFERSYFINQMEIN